MRLSHSAVKTYTECGRKYKKHYIQRQRSKFTSGALIAGNAIDKSLNVLLETKDLEAAKTEFLKTMLNTTVNGQNVYIPTSTIITYAKADFDSDLITDEDETQFKLVKDSLKYQDDRTCAPIIYELTEKKSAVGIKNLSEGERQLLALGNYLSICRKGIIMLESYNKKVIPKIKDILAVQKEIALENSEGDTVIGFIDFIATLDDDKTYILDNKTTSSMQYYPEDAPMRSQQLILYYHALKEEYNADGVGFYVIEKNIRKNKSKKCLSCGKDGTGQAHKTCDAIGSDGKRCHGVWKEKIKPEAYIALLTNEVPAAAEELVIATFDQAAEGIKNQSFGPNLSACKKNENFKCDFFNSCWNGDDSDLVVIPPSEKK